MYKIDYTIISAYNISSGPIYFFKFSFLPYTYTALLLLQLCTCITYKTKTNGKTIDTKINQNKLYLWSC